MRYKIVIISIITLLAMFVIAYANMNKTVHMTDTDADKQYLSQSNDTTNDTSYAYSLGYDGTVDYILYSNRANSTITNINYRVYVDAKIGDGTWANVYTDASALPDTTTSVHKINLRDSDDTDSCKVGGANIIRFRVVTAATSGSIISNAQGDGTEYYIIQLMSRK